MTGKGRSGRSQKVRVTSFGNTGPVRVPQRNTHGMARCGRQLQTSTAAGASKLTAGLPRQSEMRKDRLPNAQTDRTMVERAHSVSSTSTTTTQCHPIERRKHGRILQLEICKTEHSRVGKTEVCQGPLTRLWKFRPAQPWESLLMSRGGGLSIVDNLCSLTKGATV